MKWVIGVQLASNIIITIIEKSTTHDNRVLLKDQGSVIAGNGLAPISRPGPYPRL